MTVSISNIWKSALASSRPANRTGDNSHIGRTLKDLYFNGETPRTEGRFEQLLDELDTAERSRRHH
ncbi:hypothetical protein ACLE20_03000 [Rhizobium sp. YIM 134829]|uniref:hypothetical protein n=1 Tax=Rhizobium sp. YIM 134829 TaxID=3390453 RepID=UPI0039781C14